MPGLMALRDKYQSEKPLKGAKIAEFTYDNPDERLNETLVDLGYKLNGLHAIFFQLKIMQQLLLLIKEFRIRKKR